MADDNKSSPFDFRRAAFKKVVDKDDAKKKRETVINNVRGVGGPQGRGCCVGLLLQPFLIASCWRAACLLAVCRVAVACDFPLPRAVLGEFMWVVMHVCFHMPVHACSDLQGQ